MRVRHRIPSIFNLSMVDVLCCALGCFIFLWLVGAKTSKDKLDKEKALAASTEADLGKQREAVEQQRDLVQTQAAQLADAIQDLERKLKDANSYAASLQADLAGARKGAADLSRKVKDLEDLASGLRSDLKTAQAQFAVDEARVQSLQQDAALRARELDDATRKLLASQKDVALRTRDFEDAGKKLAALQLTKTKLETDLEDRNKELTLLRPYKDRWAANEEQILSLKKDLDAGRKDLADARRSADGYQAETTKWRNEAARARTEADNRFAGITLTGRRVVFMVDMSGSMEYLDEDTKAPQKWVEVRNTVARIMRSLPELEKYQVIAFSDKPHFPLGNDGKWLDYDAKSADLVLQTLAAVKPDGGTNMYSPMEMAFKLRREGLDAIYLMSDGLPNLGEGVKPEEAGTLTEQERGARLSQVIRKALKTDWNRDLDGKPRVHINTVGFFYESPDVGAFLWAMARENDGSFVGMSKP